jgi:hypothetical protein
MDDPRNEQRRRNGGVAQNAVETLRKTRKLQLIEPDAVGATGDYRVRNKFEDWLNAGQRR